ncbi:hypothetical protein EUGRSUZ_J00815 [Eucalyptus grandis]|uniref:Uncharacterized protein n=2 Tax=Eucalyptus grandis TaxID=71139 RepID=A0ACC3J5W3_EUCGR|nr:hypothetical protein EUGRSUZ_J00815 [Eucalyptus grandis]
MSRRVSIESTSSRPSSRSSGSSQPHETPGSLCRSPCAESCRSLGGARPCRSCQLEPRHGARCPLGSSPQQRLTCHG